MPPRYAARRRAAPGRLRPARLAAGIGVVAAASLLTGCASGGSGKAAVGTTVAGPATTVAELPVDVKVEGTTGLQDGQEVRIKVDAHPGSSAFGFEAFLCNGGVTFRNDADIRPTITGKCASKPLSPSSEEYKEVAASPPYQSAAASFRVGVGTDTFTKRDGSPATVTCGKGHPCQLVLKVQFPDGFAFRSYPLAYR